MSDVLQTGETFETYHKEQNAKYVGFRANHKGTHFDGLIQSFDSVFFETYLNLDEQDKAHEINYAHGLELDDIGDQYEIERNGLDDDTYRFLIKSHKLSTTSRGTVHDILSIAANLLGCEPADITLINDRKLVDGKLSGEPNTVEITDVDITKVTNPNLLALLTDELQNAMAAGFKIKQVGFSTAVKMDAFVGIAMSGHLETSMTIPPYVEVKQDKKINPYVGIGISCDYYTAI